MYTEKMSPVYICQNDKPIKRLSYICHKLAKNLSSSVSISCCRWQSGANIASNSKTFWECKHLSCQIAHIIKQISAYTVRIHILNTKN